MKRQNVDNAIGVVPDRHGEITKVCFKVCADGACVASDSSTYRYFMYVVKQFPVGNQIE